MVSGTKKWPSVCPVCFEKMKFIDDDSPDNALACSNGHTTCTVCVRKLVKPCSCRHCAKASGLSFTCPLCRAEASISSVQLLAVIKDSFVEAEVCMDAVESESEGDDDQSLAEWVTDEILEHRSAKEVERDEAVRTILKARCLTDALGLTHAADESEINPRARKLLQLLHPDFPINLAIKGTKKQLRIEAAFKKLNGLRESAT